MSIGCSRYLHVIVIEHLHHHFCVQVICITIVHQL